MTFLVVPILIFRKPRVITFLLAFIFHISNKVLFNIGIFPYQSLILSTMYFSPGWPRKLLNKPAVSDYLPEYKQLNFEILNKSQQFLLIFLTVFITFQVFFPLRHILYPGNVSWTGEGGDFSWPMKLRQKYCRFTFEIRDTKK